MPLFTTSNFWRTKLPRPANDRPAEENCEQGDDFRVGDCGPDAPRWENNGQYKKHRHQYQHAAHQREHHGSGYFFDTLIITYKRNIDGKE